MRKHLFPFGATLVACIAALVASAILLVDYVRPAPVFCGAEGGCGAMKRTIFAYPLGIPTPALGLAAFLAIAFVAFVPGKRARVAQASLAVGAGLVSIVLLGVQTTMKTFCPYCVVADTCGLVIAALSIWRNAKDLDPPRSRLALGLGAGAGLVAVIVPLAIGFSRRALPKDLPPIIAKEIDAGPKDRVTIVDFIDFECPFCRMTHHELAPLAKAKNVRVVRKQVPLHMHPHAADAARAACCAETLGKGDAMADALVAAPPEGLTPDGCEAMAASLGIDAKAFKDCVADPATEARIQADRQTFRDVKGHGLPLLFVGSHRLEGMQSRADLEHAIAQAEREL